MERALNRLRVDVIAQPDDGRLIAVDVGKDEFAVVDVEAIRLLHVLAHVLHDRGDVVGGRVVGRGKGLMEAQNRQDERALVPAEGFARVGAAACRAA